MSHANNPNILQRLRRAEGHLRTVLKMVEEGREGLEIAQQMQAVVKAIEKAKNILIIDHIENHLTEISSQLPSKSRKQLSDLREITKYL